MQLPSIAPNGIDDSNVAETGHSNGLRYGQQEEDVMCFMRAGGRAGERAEDWLDPRDQKFIPAADSVLEEWAEAAPWDMVTGVLEDAHGSRVPSYMLRNYFNQWVGWGASREMLAIAVAIVILKGLKNPVMAINTIVTNMCRRAGKIR